MQLLFGEFFRKVYNLSEGRTSLLLKVSVRLLFYSLIVIILGSIVYLFVLKKYVIILIVLGLIIVGEVAHYLRKSKEKEIVKKIPKDSSKEHAQEVLDSEKSKNKGLLKSSKAKNKELLGNR